eukprot:1865938-Ditylum_brightwellii.AAC.1
MYEDDAIYDHVEAYVDDKTYDGNKVNYDNKACIDDFWYDGNYELYGDNEADDLLLDIDEMYEEDDGVSHF